MSAQERRTAPPPARLTPVLAAIVLLAGLVIRLRLYLSGRALWHDEAMLAVNIVQRGFWGLFPPLEFRQVVPVGFLMIVKVVESLLGNTEYVLRLVPLLAGLAVMPLTYLLARRWSRGVAPLFSLALVAAAPGLIYYSSEFKQYSTDALAALILLLAGLSCLDPDSRPAALMRLGGAGLLLTWISHPAMFMLGGILITLGIDRVIRRDWTVVRRLIGLGLLVVLNLAIIYVTSMRNSIEDTGHVDFWAGSFPPALTSGALPWYEGVINILSNPLGAPLFGFAVALFLIGFVSLAARRWEWASLIASPLVLMFAASALRLYPLAERLLLFSVPAVLIVTAEGVERIRQTLKGRGRLAAHLAAAACAAYLLFAPLKAAFQQLQEPPMRDHITPALAHIRERHLDSDLVYLYYYAIPQFDYYAPLYGLDQLAHIDGVMSRGHLGAYRLQIESLAGTPRVWFIFVHNYREGRVDEQQYFLQNLDRLGTRLDEFYSPGTTIFLYDLTAPPG